MKKQKEEKKAQMKLCTQAEREESFPTALRC
jgi:hypothetical protein